MDHFCIFVVGSPRGIIVKHSAKKGLGGRIDQTVRDQMAGIPSISCAYKWTRSWEGTLEFCILGDSGRREPTRETDMKYWTMRHVGMQNTRNVSVSGKVRFDELMFFFFCSSSLSSTLLLFWFC